MTYIMLLYPCQVGQCPPWKANNSGAISQIYDHLQLIKALIPCLITNFPKSLNGIWVQRALTPDIVLNKQFPKSLNHQDLNLHCISCHRPLPAWHLRHYPSCSIKKGAEHFPRNKLIQLNQHHLRIKHVHLLFKSTANFSYLE